MLALQAALGSGYDQTMGDTYIVAEIGTSHGGDINRAAELIAAAAESGADCAKFQYVIADEIVHPNCGNVELPGGSVPLFERFRELEREPAFYLELQALCDRNNIEFLCTPFGLRSLAALIRLGVPRLKIASPEINHTQLLEAARQSGLAFILSTGVSRLSDIEYALSILDRGKVTLLHCVTTYPAPEEEYNLKLLPHLNAIFGVPVGISDHTTDPALVPGLAVALGAVTVEKHFTLSCTDSGLDDSFALDPTMFTHMSATVRRIDAILSLDPGGGRTKVLGEFAAEYGHERVQSILGDGVKRLAASEAENYATTRRSLHAVTDLASGTAISRDAVAVLRSERNLAPGLDPRYLEELLGARLTTSVAAGDGVTWSHFIERD